MSPLSTFVPCKNILGCLLKHLYLAGITLDTLELTTEFGTLNFEDIKVPESQNHEVTEESTEVPEVAIESGADFESEMQKVIEIMKIAGDDLPVSTIQTLMTDLVLKAKEDSQTEEEEAKNVQAVGTLVNLFKETNAQRAQESFDVRKPSVNPVEQELSEIVENMAKPKPDLSQILIDKAKSRPEVVNDFRNILEAPNRNKPRLHMNKQDQARILSDILINKAKARPEEFQDFDPDLLEVPLFFEAVQDSPLEVTQLPPPVEDIAENEAVDYEEYEDYEEEYDEDYDDFSQILIEKSKLRPEILKDFDSGIDLPEKPRPQEVFEEFPEHIEDFSVPPPPVSDEKKMVNLTDLLNIPSTKEMIEDHIMNMIIENPETAAADLSELFDIQNEEEKETTEEELFQMMEEDPLAVTSAFTDLIMAQKTEPISTSTAVPALSLEPIRIEDVPEEVKGKMERMKMPPKLNIVNPIPIPPQVPRIIPKTEPPFIKPLEVTGDFLNDMMTLIEEGQLSQKDVIEELINNGILPVEVTDIGKIPIIVGGKANKNGISGSIRNQPLREKPMFRSPQPREEVKLNRLQQLRAKEPEMIMRDEHHIMTEVGLDDPDGDFEMLRLHSPSRTSPRPVLPLILPSVDPTKAPEEKDIEILSSMMELYDQGMISDEELEQMVIMMEKEGVLDVDLEELGIEPEKDEPVETNTYRPYSFSESFREGGGPLISDVESFRFGIQATTRPYIQEPVKKQPKPKAMSYAHFSMQMPVKPIENTPKPPELPPPGTKGVHSAPFFKDLKMADPFQMEFEPEFKKANLNFEIPKQIHQEDIRPGPAPPFYMAARLPPPPQFKPRPTIDPPKGSTQVPFLMEQERNVFNFKNAPEPFEFDMFDPPTPEVGPRAPFPPPSELKRHAPQAPLPLILHSHHGPGYEHPHFDVPASLLNPEAYMESLTERSHQDLHPHVSSNQFLPRKGRLNFDDFQMTLRSKRKIAPIYNPPVTGLSQVDRKLDQIRQSYIQGDNLGFSLSFES